MKAIKTKNRYSMSFLVILLVVVLSCCIIVGSVLAWLKVDYDQSNQDNTLGVVAIELYADGALVRQTDNENSPYIYSAVAGSTTRTINLKMRNVGTIDAIVRANISVYYLDDNGNRVTPILTETPSATNLIKLGFSGWVSDFVSPTIPTGYMFFDSKLSPYKINGVDTPANEKSIINTITLSGAQSSTIFYIEVRLNAVAYAGNIYRKIELGETDANNIPVEAYPFGIKESLPSNWNVWR